MGAGKKWDKESKQWLVWDGANYVAEARPAGWYRNPDDPKGSKKWWDGQAWTEREEGKFYPQDVAVTMAPAFDGCNALPKGVVSTTFEALSGPDAAKSVNDAVANLQYQAWLGGGNAICSLSFTGTGSRVLATATAVRLSVARPQGGPGLIPFVGVSIPLG